MGKKYILSYALSVAFTFALLFHLTDAIYKKETGKPLLNFNYLSLGFPFTENFYFADFKLNVKSADNWTEFDPIKVIQVHAPFFISRAYWNLFTRFYLLSEAEFAAAAQGVCNTLIQKFNFAHVTEVEFVSARKNINEIKKIYVCKS